MSFVLGASVACCWAFPDEHNEFAKAAFTALRTSTATVPDLWWTEVANVLLSNERRGRIDPGVTDQFMSELLDCPLITDRTPNWATVLSLTRRHRLTAYGARYLELALRLKQPLATLDKQLIAAARQEGIRIGA